MAGGFAQEKFFAHHRNQPYPEVDVEFVPEHIFAVHRIIQRAKVDGGFVPIRFSRSIRFFAAPNSMEYLCQTALQPSVPTAAPTDALTEIPTDAPTEVPSAVPTEIPTDVPTKSGFRNEKDMKKGFHPMG